MIYAVSIRQPFASLILAGVKRYEARSWHPKSFGWLLLHASGNYGTCHGESQESPYLSKAFQKANLPHDRKAWSRSAIIGAFEVTGILNPPFKPRQFTKIDEATCGDNPDLLWKIGERIAFPSPIHCHGKLNLFLPPDSVLAEVKKYLSL
jgi:hypothetical protein